MITKDNLKEVLNNLDKQEIEEALNHVNDYVLIELSVFNIGSITRISSIDYNQETQEEAQANGNLFLDKDDFLMLLNEFGIEIEW